MRRALSAVVVPLVLFVAACGVPADKSPRAIPANEVPFDLLTPSATQPAPTLPASTVPATIYLIGPQKLVAAKRTVPSPLSLGGVLASLVQGPTDPESSAGLRSAINPQTSVLSAQINGDTASVNMSDAFSSIAVQDQILALAQVVYTATELPNVARVQISLDSKPAEVPKGDGSSSKDPLVRSDYAALAP